MNKGVIFFIVIVLAVLAIIFIPNNKDANVPVTDETMVSDQMNQDLQGSAIEAIGDVQVGTNGTTDVPMTDASAEGVVEVPTTETTPEAVQ